MLVLIMLGFYCGLILATFTVLNKLKKLKYKIKTSNNKKFTSYKKQ